MSRLLATIGVVAALAAMAGPSRAERAGSAPEASPGVVAFNRAQYAAAAQSFAREVQAAPGDLGLRLNWAVALLQMKDYAAAAAQLDQAIRIAPGASILRDLHASAVQGAKSKSQGALLKAGTNVSVVRSAGGAEDSSVGVLLQVLQEHPASAAAANLLGDACQLRGDLSGAERWYRKAAGLAPGWTRPLVGLALTVLDTDPTRSANLLEDVVRREPSNAQAKLWLGDAYRRTGKPDLAERYYLQAAEDPVTRADALVRRGTQYMVNNQALRAQEQFSKAEAADPGNLPAALGMAQAKVLQNDFGEARKSAEDAAARSAGLSPATQSTVYLNAAQIAQAAGDYSEAQVYFDTANRLDPGSQTVYAQQADLHTRQGNISTWNDQHERALKDSPDNLTALRSLAEGYRASGEHQKRLAVVERLVDVDAANSWMWRLQAAESLWALGRKTDACDRWVASVDAGYPTRTIRIADSIGSLAGAAQYVQARLAALKPTRNTHHLQFALDRRAGHLEQALAEIDSVIALDPDNVTLIGQRGSLLQQMGRGVEAEEAFRRQRELTRAQP